MNDVLVKLVRGCSEDDIDVWNFVIIVLFGLMIIEWMVGFFVWDDFIVVVILVRILRLVCLCLLLILRIWNIGIG